MKNFKKSVFCNIKRKLGEPIVKNGLAVTPAQALKMAEQGIPISGQMSYQLNDGHLGSDWSLSLDERRGVDIGLVWQEQQSARARFRKVYDKSVPVITSE